MKIKVYFYIFMHIAQGRGTESMFGFCWKVAEKIYFVI